MGEASYIADRSGRQVSDKTDRDTMSDELLGLGEIAELLGVKPKTPGIWRYRGVLPDPDLLVSGKPLWFRGTVVGWAKATGRWPHG